MPVFGVWRAASVVKWKHVEAFLLLRTECYRCEQVVTVTGEAPRPARLQSTHATTTDNSVITLSTSYPKGFSL